MELAALWSVTAAACAVWLSCFWAPEGASSPRRKLRRLVERGSGALQLAHLWDGCGDGAWRSARLGSCALLPDMGSGLSLVASGVA
jgi:hypothetical protein